MSDSDDAARPLLFFFLHISLRASRHTKKTFTILHLIIHKLNNLHFPHFKLDAAALTLHVDVNQWRLDGWKLNERSCPKTKRMLWLSTALQKKPKRLFLSSRLTSAEWVHRCLLESQITAVCKKTGSKSRRRDTSGNYSRSTGTQSDASGREEVRTSSGWQVMSVCGSKTNPRNQRRHTDNLAFLSKRRNWSCRSTFWEIF